MMLSMAPAPPHRTGPGDPGPSDPWLVELFREHHHGLVQLAALLVDDRGTAEEIVQDAFVSTALRRGRGLALDDPLAYLRRAVANGARSALRRRGVRRRHLRSVEPPPTAPGADHDVLAAAEHEPVLAALRTLSDRQREVLVLRYWSELSEVEIADALGISPGSVKTHAHRGLAELTRILEAESP